MMMNDKYYVNDSDLFVKIKYCAKKMPPKNKKKPQKQT
jgi:hypothetical protein